MWSFNILILLHICFGEIDTSLYAMYNSIFFLYSVCFALDELQRRSENNEQTVLKFKGVL